MIRSRGTLAWLLGAALLIGAVAVARVGTANMIQNRPINQTVFDNAGQPWPFFNQVAAINYDKGGQGLGYNVPSPDTADCPDGATYRPDAVNLKTSTAGAPAIPFQIGCTFGPNSYNYTINISQSGPYQITLQLADNSTGGSWNILIDGAVVANVPTPNTGPGFDTFAPSTSGPFTASLGTHKMTIGWATGDVNFAGAGDFLTWQGGVAPATTIRSVSMDCGNTCGFVGGTAGPVGTAHATMSTGSFAGTWSLRTSGTDNFGVTCNNYTGSFSIASGTGVVSNGAIASGTYAGVCVVATQAGAGGSPFAQAVTITGSGSGVATPTIAQNANFTTLAANYDFSQPQYATQANWLDCNNNNDSVAWHKGSPGFTTTLPCNINQEVDPLTGQKAVAITFLTSYNGQQTGNGAFVSMQTYNNTSNSFTGYPNGSFIEITVRENGTYNDGNNNESGPDSLYVTSRTFPTRWFELDAGELFASADGFAGGHVFNWNVAPGSFIGDTWLSYNGDNHLPAGWSVTTYHTYGMLLTNNGSTAYVCAFVDEIFQGHCYDMQATSDEIPSPYYLTVWAGGSNVAVNKKLYISSIRVWSCANWANQMVQQTSPVCTGPTLFNSGGLTYYH